MVQSEGPEQQVVIAPELKSMHISFCATQPAVVVVLVDVVVVVAVVVVVLVDVVVVASLNVVVVVVVVVVIVEVAGSHGDVVAGTFSPPNNKLMILSTRVGFLVVVSVSHGACVVVGAAVVVSRGKRIPKNLSFSCSARGTQKV